MHGLTVRWSLADAPEGAEQELADYVAGTSHARFTGMPGLRFKTWRMRSGEWFEGCYVFESAEECRRFHDDFAAGAADAGGGSTVRRYSQAVFAGEHSRMLSQAGENATDGSHPAAMVGRLVMYRRSGPSVRPTSATSSTPSNASALRIFISAPARDVP